MKIIKELKIDVTITDKKESTNIKELEQKIKSKLKADDVKIKQVKTFVLGDKE